MLSSGMSKFLNWLVEQYHDVQSDISNYFKDMNPFSKVNRINRDLMSDSEDPFYVGNSGFANSIIKKSNSVDSASLGDAINNWFTGNLDYARQFELQQNAQAFNAEEAQKARDYNLEMSNTAYQRQVSDLEAAGLNPLVALGGSGATSGYSVSSSSGVGSAPRASAGIEKMFGSMFGLLSSALNNAVQTNNLDKKLELMKNDQEIKKDYYTTANKLRASSLSFYKDRQSKIDTYMRKKDIDRAKSIVKKLIS